MPLRFQQWLNVVSVYWDGGVWRARLSAACEHIALTFTDGRHRHVSVWWRRGWREMRGQVWGAYTSLHSSTSLSGLRFSCISRQWHSWDLVCITFLATGFLCVQSPPENVRRTEASSLGGKRVATLQTLRHTHRRQRGSFLMASRQAPCGLVPIQWVVYYSG